MDTMSSLCSVLLMYAVYITMSVTQSTAQPNVCWDSVWYNEYAPSTTNRSDYEHQSSKVLSSVCTTGSVIDAQCKDEKGESFKVFKNDTSNMYIATCNVVTGLICNPYNNTQQICPNFAIQYGCPCVTTRYVVGTSNTRSGAFTSHMTSGYKTRVLGKSQTRNTPTSNPGARTQTSESSPSQHEHGTDNGCIFFTYNTMCLIVSLVIFFSTYN